VSEPRFQLWITDRDGSNPRLVAAHVGTAVWSPDGSRLALTAALGIDFYVCTLDMATGEVTQWTGQPGQDLDFPVVSHGDWFADGARLLVYVAQKAYQQPFPRGLYVLDTRDSTVSPPLVEFFEGTYLGYDDSYALGRKYLADHGPLSGNYARYDFATDSWDWVTRVAPDSLRFFEIPVPSPASPQVVQARLVEHADQLFLFPRPEAMQWRPRAEQQLTTLGGDNPTWTHDGRQVVFRRDVHRGPGARYVPFVYDLETGTEEALWPTQPDSLPSFPPVASQDFVLLPLVR
jgi:Tol biopolymer transport system component